MLCVTCRWRWVQWALMTSASCRLWRSIQWPSLLCTMRVNQSHSLMDSLPVRKLTFIAIKQQIRTYSILYTVNDTSGTWVLCLFIFYGSVCRSHLSVSISASPPLMWIILSQFSKKNIVLTPSEFLSLSQGWILLPLLILLLFWQVANLIYTLA